ncbi:uncharacterized protein TRIADDRAFT_52073 [Trichoplax adhaerens]|uniref:Uncharacterized protein n=1 Tax=Trichoplax adhaerens TaxID=10228 RepID=B3RLP3_TRIAD|nr:hypothetical protein TRIADDRAFT_52073 [Trichoplax adhaerens]EDV29562.1 hypothetical protein TRIADDRAFT_52073 [Trichoplax adhaerens]|eukprot:XP_002108764.1 hypothetical protein TRIADDRAFT_52073 [Trichoplax adhaerens]
MKGQTKEEASVVIDLENAGDREFFTEGNTDKSASQSSYDDKGTDIAGQVGKYAATQVLQQGQQQVRNALNFYANIDILRPYFDVEPIQVRDRLLRSLVPVKPSSMQQASFEYGDKL